MASGAVLSVVARRNAMSPQHLLTWLRRARQTAASVRATLLSFVPALLKGAASDPASSPARDDRHGLAAAIQLEVAGIVVRIGAAAAAITAVIRALNVNRRAIGLPLTG